MMVEDAASTIIEGFLCPICLQNLGSFHQLHSHFEAEHSPAEKQLLGQIKGIFGNVKKALNVPVTALNPFEADSSDADSVHLPKRNPLLLSSPQPPGSTTDHTDTFKAMRTKRLNQFVVQSNSLVIRLQKLVNYAVVDDPRLPFEKELVPWIDDAEVSLCPGCGRKFLPAVRKKHHCRLCGAIMCDECSVNLDIESARNVLRDIFRDTATPTGTPLPSSSSSAEPASFVPSAPRSLQTTGRFSTASHSNSPTSSYTSSPSPSQSHAKFGTETRSSNLDRYNSDSTITSVSSLSGDVGGISMHATNGFHGGGSSTARSRSPSIASTTNSSQVAAGGGGTVSSVSALLRSAVVRMPRIGSLSSSFVPGGDDVGGGRFSRLSSFSSATPSTSLKDDIKAIATRYSEDGLVLVKMCRPCWLLVERRARAKHRSARAHDTALLEKYEALRKNVDAAEVLFSKYETMATALRAADDTIDLDEANRVRARLCAIFELIDTSSKSLISVPSVVDTAVDPPTTLAAEGSAAAETLALPMRSVFLRRKIRQHAVDLLQQRCLTMTPLPTYDELSALKTQREDERKSRWLQAQQHQQEQQLAAQQQQQQQRKHRTKATDSSSSSSLTSIIKTTTTKDHHSRKDAAAANVNVPKSSGGFMPEPVNPFEIDEYDDPLKQQIAQIREYLQQARDAARVDEINILEANLKELTEAYQQKLSVNDKSSSSTGEDIRRRRR